ncbi:MAG: RNA 2',3'-cyclic phosphodiesterase [Candidatus Komeilibacteria bacterium]|jgi:RNA 2',3'-cyclic 3'-phosphodiesterase|nr:RNA 2',3'-cyclic phosphodiesterase [Candidatus Komeilibacteria bacterium]MBT4447656.1 RNA 2',3'-cyclic phosphodiesterase [Candidatus Komeilibacteria bacterium]
METKRLFISLPIDPSIVKDIFKKFEALDLPWEKIKKVHPDQIHLTLKFLGEMPIDKIPDIIDSLNKLDLAINDLELEIDQTEIFNERQPKVLVLKIKENEILQNLYDEIEQVLFEDGLAHKEVRKFSTHLTLARVKQTADFKEFKEFENWSVQKSFFASYFELIESELSKTGPSFTSLQAFDL